MSCGSGKLVDYSQQCVDKYVHHQKSHGGVVEDYMHIHLPTTYLHLPARDKIQSTGGLCLGKRKRDRGKGSFREAAIGC